MTIKYKLADKQMKTVVSFDGTVIYRNVHRIQALIDIPEIGVKKGDLGGFVECEYNLSHEGNCWIFDEATVIGNAQVFENALVKGNAHMLENSKAYGESIIRGETILKGHTVINDYCVITKKVCISGNASFHGNIRICGDIKIEIDLKDIEFEGSASIGFKPKEVNSAIDALEKLRIR